MPEIPTRREFCAYACQAASVLAVGAVAGCGGSPTSPSTSAPPLTSVTGSVAGRAISVTIDAASPLASVGAGATVQTSLGTFLLARTAQDAFTAFSATCTHEACTITGFATSQFVCPCHGSRFSTAGTVINGPATRALPQFATQFTGGVLTFVV